MSAFHPITTEQRTWFYVGFNDFANLFLPQNPTNVGSGFSGPEPLLGVVAFGPARVPVQFSAER
jgi:hypothetical protein